MRLLRNAGHVHGDSPSGRRAPEYLTWTGMIARCEGATPHPNYGGRGIRVSPKWRKSYAAFLADMGRRPSPEHTIDRIDNNGNYEPGNCRWATKSEQARNRRPHFDPENTLTYRAKCAGISYGTFRSRVWRGWSVEEAMSPKKYTNGESRMTARGETIDARIKRAGVNPHTFWARVMRGWSVEDALSPKDHRRR